MYWNLESLDLDLYTCNSEKKITPLQSQGVSRHFPCLDSVPSV